MASPWLHWAPRSTSLALDLLVRQKFRLPEVAALLRGPRRMNGRGRRPSRLAQEGERLRVTERSMRALGSAAGRLAGMTSPQQRRRDDRATTQYYVYPHPQPLPTRGRGAHRGPTNTVA